MFKSVARRAGAPLTASARKPSTSSRVPATYTTPTYCTNSVLAASSSVNVAMSSSAGTQKRFSSSANKDYYKTLGITKTSTPHEIKKAYRERAMSCHPDKGGSAAEFAEVNEAYAVLSDKEKRQMYDQYGSEAAQNHGNGGGHRTPEDIFSEFFRGSGMGGKSRAKVRDIDVELTLTLEEMYRGTEKSIKVNRPALCGDCRGKGTKSGDEKPKCTSCKGSGQTVTMHSVGAGMYSQTMMTCSKCSGKGHTCPPSDRCTKCRGEGYHSSAGEVQIPVPAGCPDNVVMRVPGEGGVMPDATPGDINVHIKMRPNSTYTRKGNDLLMNLEITFAEAFMGVEKTIKMPDGRAMCLKSPALEVLQNGSVLKLAGEGMPASSGSMRGDIYVFIHVKVPKTLTVKQRETLEEVFGKPHKDTHASAGNTLDGRLMKENKEQLMKMKEHHWEEQETGRSSSRGGGRASQAECSQQ